MQLVCVGGCSFFNRKVTKRARGFPCTLYSVSPMLPPSIAMIHSSQLRNQEWHVTINETAHSAEPAGPSCLPNLLRSVTVSEPVLVLDDFDMTALRSAAQLFCRMSPFEDKTVV